MHRSPNISKERERLALRVKAPTRGAPLGYAVGDTCLRHFFPAGNMLVVGKGGNLVLQYFPAELQRKRSQIFNPYSTSPTSAVELNAPFYGSSSVFGCERRYLFAPGLRDHGLAFLPMRKCDKQNLPVSVTVPNSNFFLWVTQYVRILQGRRAAMSTGMFGEVFRSNQTNINPTEMASTSTLRGALGVIVTGEAAAKVVIGRMIRNRKARMLQQKQMELAGRGSEKNRRKAANGRSRRGRCVNRRGGGQSNNSIGRHAVKGRAPQTADGGVRSGGFLGEGVFKTVLSSMAKNRLRMGLQEINTNPADVLRSGLVEIEPARYGSTALGCHLIKGWAEQKGGNKRRVSANNNNTNSKILITIETGALWSSGRFLA